MFGFIKKLFVVTMTFFGCNVLNVNPLKCVSMDNQECKIRTKIISVNSNEPSFYPYSIKVNKCSDICYNINDLYSKLCVPNAFKNINVKVFNILSRTNKIRHTGRHETCQCM